MLSALQFFTPQMRPNLKALSKCVQMLCDSVIFTSVVSKYRFFYIPPIKINCFKGSVIYCCSLAHDTKELIPLGFVAIGCYITIINIAFFSEVNHSIHGGQKERREPHIFSSSFIITADTRALLRQWERDGVMTHIQGKVMVCNWSQLHTEKVE